MKNIILFEGVKISQADIKEIMSDENIKVGWELEFIARPEAYNRDRPTVDIVTTPITSRMLTTYFTQLDRLENYIRVHYIPEHFQDYLSRDDNASSNEFLEDYMSSHRNQGRFYPNQETFNEYVIDHLWSKPDIQKHWAINRLRGMSLDQIMNFIVNNDQIRLLVSYIQQSGIMPIYGWANEEKTKIYTSAPQGLEMDEIRIDMARVLGVPVRYQGDSMTQYVLKTDASVRPDGDELIQRAYGDRANNVGRGQMSFEFTTPPEPIKNSIDKMTKIFTWMQEKGHYTNESTGFHISVSMANKPMVEHGEIKIDYLKLAVLMGEEHVLVDQFDRYDTLPHNTTRQGAYHNVNYSKPLLPDLKDALKRGTTIPRLLNMPVGRAWIDKIQPLIQHEKYRSFNLQKLESNPPYIEFRMAGNRNYHQNIEKMKKLIIRYAFMIKISLDPEAFKNEYYKKLRQLVMDAAEKIESSDSYTSGKADYISKQEKHRSQRNQPDLPDDPFESYVRTAYNKIKSRLTNPGSFESDFRDMLAKGPTAPVSSSRSLVRVAFQILKQDDLNRRNNPEAKLMSTSLGLPLCNKIKSKYGFSSDMMAAAVDFVTRSLNDRISNRFSNKQILDHYFNINGN